MTSEERHEARYQRRKARREARRLERFKDALDFDKVFTYDHLYKSYLKCRKDVMWKGSTQKYVVQAPLNVYITYKKLMDGKFKTGVFREFDIYERGKKRHIKSVPIGERVVQKCLCDYSLTPVLESSFIYDNGASRKHKGYHFAMRRLKGHLQRHYRKYGTDGYVLLFDFSKFFDNVSHAVIKDIIRSRYTDERLIKLIFHFIDAFGDQGLGLGSQVSQTLALASANALDHAIKEDMGIEYYGRYMDDGYLIHPSKTYLRECLEKIRIICSRLGIRLNEKKTRIVKLSHGFTYLKARIFLLPSGRIVKKVDGKSVTRERRKLKKLKTNPEITPEDLRTSFLSWRAYAMNFNAHYTIRSIEELFFGREKYVLQGITGQEDRRCL